ncbi:MAG: XRE family transcriptional regulator [Sphingobacteriia bacterium]|nr:XRE family transcriptional regulator [Sphingobacteriia bacterium]NCC41317.1 XRE family transcriptional regulator [Gammaproteobacteria bacterium]
MDIAALRKQIGHRIKVRRVELDFGQVDLADRLGVPQSRVSAWERGQAGIRLEQAVAIAAVLQTSVANLVGETTARGDARS